MDVQVNVDSLNSNSNSIAEYIGAYDLSVEGINGIIDEISTIWKGSDHDTFQTKITYLLDELTKFRESLSKYQEFISGYVSAINALDNSYGSKNITLK